MLGNKYVAALVGVLLLIVIAYNAKYFMSRGRNSSPAENAAQSTKKTGSDLKHQGTAAPAAIQPPARADKGPWKRDPFSLQSKPEGKPVEAVPDIKLAGIIKRDDRSFALIDGKVYGINDRIGHAVIQEIKQHSIVILSDGRKHEISFEDYKVIKEKKK